MKKFRKIYIYIYIFVFAGLSLYIWSNPAKIVLADSDIATISSAVYTIVDNGDGTGMILNVPNRTLKADFLANITKDHPGQIWDDSGIGEYVVHSTDGFSVTAEDGFGFMYYGFDNNPFASISIEINPSVGETISADYDYSDTEGALEGATTFQWYKFLNGQYSAIDGATSSNYTVLPGDEGALLYFGVTAKALTGSNAASERLSKGLFVDLAPVANQISITGSGVVGQYLTGQYSYSNSYYSWEAVGPTPFSEYRASQTRIVVGPDDLLYAIYPKNEPLGITATVVKKYNGSNWVDLSGSYLSSHRAYNHPDINFNSAGELYIVYQDLDRDTRIIVAKHNGSDWVEVGTNPVSAGKISAWNGFPVIEFDQNDVPYLAYSDDSNSNKLYIKKYNGSDWVDFGTNPITGSYTANWDLDLKSSTPYVSYSDLDNNFKLSVKKYNGSNWVDVGVNPISSGNASWSEIETDSGGIPYVAYNDDANNNMLYVKKFNGINWEEVGINPISVNDAQNINLRILDDNLYVGYEEYPNMRLGADFILEASLMVKKFNLISPESGWVNLVTPSFNTAGADSSSFDVDSNGKPYFGYNDGNTNFGINDDTNWFASAKGGQLNTDLEGVSTYQWYRGGIPISGATSLTYKVQEADRNQNIYFEVTPKAQTGTLVGQSVQASTYIPLFDGYVPGAGIVGTPVPAIESGGGSSVITDNSTPLVINGNSNENLNNITENENSQTTENPEINQAKLYKFLTNLKLGSRGEDVKELQKILNKNGFVLTNDGYGALGNETSFFGRLTHNAVVKLQNEYSDLILKPLNIKNGTGIFGPSTRAFLNSQYEAGKLIVE